MSGYVSSCLIWLRLERGRYGTEMDAFGTNVRFLSRCFAPYLVWRFRRADARLFLFPFAVTFRMVVFRPFVSEVILAKVKSSDEDGIRRMLVFLSPAYLPKLTAVPRSFC